MKYDFGWLLLCVVKMEFCIVQGRALSVAVVGWSLRRLHRITFDKIFEVLFAKKQLLLHWL